MNRRILSRQNFQFHHQSTHHRHLDLSYLDLYFVRKNQTIEVFHNTQIHAQLVVTLECGELDHFESHLDYYHLQDLHCF